ncbi:MAG: response regulator [Desulfobacteria bacterium]
MNKKLKILIVDDNTGLAHNLNDILKENGYKTAVALDGQSAIKLCRKREFSLALVDIKLPDISGLKLTEKLSDSSSTMEYIIITGHSTIDREWRST